MNELERAVIESALNGGGLPLTFEIPPDAAIAPGDGPDIWDGLTMAAWFHDG